MPTLRFLFAVSTLLLTAVFAGAQDKAADCRQWTVCRDRALEAAARHDYETFHDLAWRAMQTRGAKDPDIMYLLARAQALSGRPHDALIMLERLAEMRVVTDAAENDDFKRTRALPGWADLQEMIDKIDKPEAAPALGPSGRAPEPSVASGAPAAPARVSPATPVLTPAPTALSLPATDVVRFSVPAFAAGGLAYDEVSRRFVIGNLPDRTLSIVDETSSRENALAGATAGFLDVTGIDIDTPEGDLWVVSADRNGAEPRSMLHKLQLVSGRVLKVYHPGPAYGSARFVDVAVAARRQVLVLDAAGPRLVRPSAEGDSIETVIDLPQGDALSLAPAAASIVYVAYTDRLVRVDTAARTATPLSAASGVALDGLQRIRWARGALIGLRQDEKAERQLVRVELSRSGRHALALRALDAVGETGSDVLALSVAGENLYYLVRAAGQNPDASAGTIRAPAVIRHIRLRR